MLNPTQFQAKEEKIQVADDLLNEADPLSKCHPLSEASNSLSGWETQEEKESEMCLSSGQPTHPPRILSLLALSTPSLVKPKFTYSRLASLWKLKGPRTFKTLKLVEIKGRVCIWKQKRHKESSRESLGQKREKFRV